MSDLTGSQLGIRSEYKDQYDPNLLFRIERRTSRDLVGIDSHALPFHGADIWNAFEVSWLNSKGKPCVGIATITVPADSPAIFESKSLKLFLNSLNQTRLTTEQVVNHLYNALSQVTGTSVQVDLQHPHEFDQQHIQSLSGTCIDEQDIAIDCYHGTDPQFLTVDTGEAEEVLVSHLLKSNCLITHQPDWASVQIHYQGPKINHAGLLRYICSFRQHNEFHEPCIERMFMDITRQCRPNKLAVYGRFTRRGGIDINPWRSNFDIAFSNDRLARQ